MQFRALEGFFQNENGMFCGRGTILSLLPQPPLLLRAPPSSLAPVCGVESPPRPVQPGEGRICGYVVQPNLGMFLLSYMRIPDRD